MAASDNPIRPIAAMGPTDLEGGRHDLRAGRSPDAPAVDDYTDGEGAIGYVHSYESGSTLDGPGIRVTLFVSGCPLRCLYCHNPDTWHLKDGTQVPLAFVVERLGHFAPALRSMGGGLTISGGEPLVQLAFTQRLFAAAKAMGLHTALDTSGFLGGRVSDAYLDQVDLVLLDIKAWNPDTYRRLTRREIEPTLHFAERLAAIGKPTWVRYVLVPGLTDDDENIDGVGRFVAPMTNVEWLEVLPFHQLGAFKWAALGLDYELADTPAASPERAQRAVERFRAAGCNAR